MTARFAAFVRLSRPHFLVGGVLAFLLGTVVGAGSRPIDWSRFWIGQAMITSAQLATQYANEYFDREGDRHVARRTLFSGGSGVLPAGLMRPGIALTAATASAVAALILAGAVAATTPAAGLLGVLALAGGLAYSAPPFRLVASGWGELVASLIVAALVPAAGALVQGGIPTDLFGPIITLVAIHGAMILALALPDIDADRIAGKCNVAVRLGPGGTVKAIRALLGVAGIALAGATTMEPAFGWAAAAVLPGVILFRASEQITRTTGLTLAAVATFAVAAGGFVAGAFLAY